jgi:hypothetical protein
MSDNDLILRLTQERFAATNAMIASNQEQLKVLTEKTERSGETDGFRQYLFAELPFAADGMTEVRFAFVTNGRDIGEGAGMGTGVLCVYKPTPIDEWRVIGTNVAVTV